MSLLALRKILEEQGLLVLAVAQSPGQLSASEVYPYNVLTLNPWIGPAHHISFHSASAFIKGFISNKYVDKSYKSRDNFPPGSFKYILWYSPEIISCWATVCSYRDPMLSSSKYPTCASTLWNTGRSALVSHSTTQAAWNILKLNQLKQGKSDKLLNLSACWNAFHHFSLREWVVCLQVTGLARGSVLMCRLDWRASWRLARYECVFFSTKVWKQFMGFAALSMGWKKECNSVLIRLILRKERVAHLFLLP